VERGRSSFSSGLAVSIAFALYTSFYRAWGSECREMLPCLDEAWSGTALNRIDINSNKYVEEKGKRANNAAMVVQELDITRDTPSRYHFVIPATSLYRSKRKFSPSTLRTSETYLIQHNCDPIVLILVYEMVILNTRLHFYCWGNFNLES